MHLLKWIVAVSLLGFLGACASGGQEGSRAPMFGKNARLLEIGGEVIGVSTNGWGNRYIVVKDRSTGLRVYVQSKAGTCAPGKVFRATGHLTRAQEKDYDATFHSHLTDNDKACG